MLVQKFKGETIMNKCLNCDSETLNLKFCSSSCSATFNNKRRKRPIKPKGFCKHCKEPVFTRNRYCPECNLTQNPNLVDWRNVTLSECFNKRTYQRSSRIRSLAKRWYEKIYPDRKCSVCGYINHVHVCHIKPITSFSLDTTLGVVNHPDNLIYLCPNHHWEFDNGMIKLG